ncbi:hypothetical protein ABZV91_30980 [Nocardia sp. NPDC004568]|uniref:hypothetical protein n=1 Tax=Nocardia sp. NPDC004568 TaxID=3154551 RepID=UPI00339E1C3D
MVVCPGSVPGWLAGVVVCVSTVVLVGAVGAVSVWRAGGAVGVVVAWSPGELG